MDPNLFAVMLFPDRIPGVKNLDLRRTALANVLYAFGAAVILECENGGQSANLPSSLYSIVAIPNTFGVGPGSSLPLLTSLQVILVFLHLLLGSPSAGPHHQGISHQMP